MHLWCLIVALGAINFLAGITQATSLAQVTLGNTVVTGISQTFVGVGVEFFGGRTLSNAPKTSLQDSLRLLLQDFRSRSLQWPAYVSCPPVPVMSMNATSFDATQFGPACAQQTVRI